MEYSITDKMAVSFSLPVVATKYTGTRPPPTRCGPAFDVHSHADDGNWHGTVQDFNLGLRYNVVQNPLMVTPFIRAVIPSHDYIADGEAAQGRHLRELQMGTHLGRLLDPFLPDAYVQTTIAYTVVERPLDVPLNRTNVALEFGYFVGSSIAVRSFGTYQRTHGGFARAPCTTELFEIHDGILRDNHWRGGVGVSYLLNQSLGLDASYVRVISGSSSHYGSGVSIGLNWIFGRGVKEIAGIASKGIPFADSQEVVFCGMQ